MRIRKYTDEQIKNFCSNRVSVAIKYRFVNFWTFIQLDLIECKFADESKKRIHALRSPAQNTIEICHTAPNSASPKAAQISMELEL